MHMLSTHSPGYMQPTRSDLCSAFRVEVDYAHAGFPVDTQTLIQSEFAQTIQIDKTKKINRKCRPS